MKYLNDTYKQWRGEEAVQKAISEQGLHLHHDAWQMGYVSRKTTGWAIPYKGKFGEGLVWYRPSWKSTRCCVVEYWVK